MKSNRLAVAALAALAIALEAAFLHALVAAPLATAVRDADDQVRPTFEESILVRAVARTRAPIVPVRGS